MEEKQEEEKRGKEETHLAQFYSLDNLLCNLARLGLPWGGHGEVVSVWWLEERSVLEWALVARVEVRRGKKEGKGR
jgi:hypothetical protein